VVGGTRRQARVRDHRHRQHDQIHEPAPAHLAETHPAAVARMPTTAPSDGSVHGRQGRALLSGGAGTFGRLRARVVDRVVCEPALKRRKQLRRRLRGEARLDLHGEEHVLSGCSDQAVDGPRLLVDPVLVRDRAVPASASSSATSSSARSTVLRASRSWRSRNSGMVTPFVAGSGPTRECELVLKKGSIRAEHSREDLPPDADRLWTSPAAPEP